MKANELMIGDLVYYNHTEDGIAPYKEVIRINAEDLCCDACILETHYEPIPITPEILEKNGFKFDGTNRWESHESGLDAFIVPVQPDNDWWDKYSTRIEVCTRRADLLIEAVEQIFVHQLQQFLRLCGIEKEIVL